MNVKALIGMKVFAVDAGKDLGVIERLLFSPEQKQVVSFVISPEAGLLDEPSAQRLLPADKIKGVGHDAITVESEALLETAADGEIPTGLVAFDEVEKERVLTESGDDVGELASIEFSETDFRLEYLEVGRGFLSGHSLISLNQVVSIGEDAIVVTDTALEDVTPREEAAEAEEEERL